MWVWLAVAVPAAIAAFGFASGRLGLGVTWAVLALIGALGLWLRKRGDFGNPRLVVGLGAVAMGVAMLAFVALAIAEGDTKYLALPIVLLPMFLFATWAWSSSGRLQRQGSNGDPDTTS
jgi:hypothetical protein